MEPMSRKVRLLYFVLFCAAFVVSIPLISLYASGYRLGKDLSLYKTGGIYIHTTEAGADLSVNGKPRRHLGAFDRSMFLQNLRPGTYYVSLTKHGFASWEKALRVNEGVVTETAAFLMPQSFPLRPVPGDAREIRELFLPPRPDQATTTRALRNANPLLTEEQPLLRSKIAIWKEGNAVYAKWSGSSNSIPHFFCADTCKPSRKVYEAQGYLGHVAFYPGRTDTLLIGLPSGIYAVGIDDTVPQYFKMFYQREGVDFRVDDDVLYIKEGGVISLAEL